MRLNNMPGFTAEDALDSRGPSSPRKGRAIDAMNNDVVVPQLPRWLKCAAYITAEVGACLEGPNPVCIAAGAKALDACT
jgi:hypothetical protein